MSEFDYWRKDTLDVLADALRAHDTPPKPSDPFWKAVLEDISAAEEEVSYDAKELAQDVANEFENASFMYPPHADGVACGDLGCAESRLVSAVKGIKGVVFCASHPMEPLWGSDGLSYHTLVVSPAIEPSKTLSSELHAALNFIKAHKPALICSSCPTLPALVVAAYSHKESGGRIPIRAALASTQSALGIHPSEVSAAELAELDTFASNLDRSMGVPPPPPNSSPNADYQSDESVGSGASKDDEEEDDDDGEPELLDVEDEALQTPRPKPLTFSTSNDSTITQVDAELIGAETPKKRVAQPPEEAHVMRKGQWKRSRSNDVEAFDLASPSKRAERAEQLLTRGTCTTCKQVDVLGWAARVGAASSFSIQYFTCCACHDAHDADEDE